MLASAIIATESAQAQTLSTLHSFAYPHGAFPRGGVDPGHRWKLLRNDDGGRGQSYGTAFKITPRRQADHALQLLRRTLLRGRRLPNGGADPGNRWGLLWDDHGDYPGQERRHSLQNYSRRHPDDALQVLLGKRLCRRH